MQQDFIPFWILIWIRILYVAESSFVLSMLLFNKLNSEFAKRKKLNSENKVSLAYRLCLGLDAGLPLSIDFHCVKS